jgi:Thyroglobulin type-1 repeat.
MLAALFMATDNFALLSNFLLHISEKQPCWSELQGLRKTKSPAGEVFMPACLPDGRYESVQCHGSTGYCWCVTASGAPIPNTSVRHVKPNCPRRGK